MYYIIKARVDGSGGVWLLREQHKTEDAKATVVAYDVPAESTRRSEHQQQSEKVSDRRHFSAM